MLAALDGTADGLLHLCGKWLPEDFSDTLKAELRLMDVESGNLLGKVSLSKE